MEDQTVLFESEFWQVILSNDQAYLGRCRINLKRDSGELSDLSSEEWTDFHKNIINKLENALKKAFSAKMFNWTCLMNNAYKSDNPQPHVHWHFRPRYEKNVNFAEEHFEDLEFAHHYDRKREKVVSKKILDKISEEIRKFL